MDIKLFVTENGQIALACYDGAFSSPVQSIELDMLTTMMSIRLEDSEDSIELNCPVHQDVIECMIGQKICTVGFYLQNQLAGAMYVPFHMTNMPVANGRMVQ